MADPGHNRGDIAAIVLAAGASQRFGSDKLLHPLTLRGATMPLAAHSLLPWLETFRQISVVVRPGANVFRSAIEAALGMGNGGGMGKGGADRSAPINWIACADAAQGMAASLACGVRANLEAEGWLIGLADMPAVPVEAITRVRKALSKGAAIAVPAHAGRRGHPVGFARRYRIELLALQGDAGARRLLQRDEADVVEIGIDDAGIFADIDIPDDLQNL
ncbi:MAG TPA: nucleotidyltransferase family protein [Gallionella sp.]|nr:nucleotidyltransferase family protein [Gallionella sp.]